MKITKDLNVALKRKRVANEKCNLPHLSNHFLGCKQKKKNTDYCIQDKSGKK